MAGPVESEMKIVGVLEGLKRTLKSEAALKNQSLSEYVVWILEHRNELYWQRNAASGAGGKGGAK